jgi:DNA-binding protein HU-beta
MRVSNNQTQVRNENGQPFAKVCKTLTEVDLEDYYHDTSKNRCFFPRFVPVPKRKEEMMIKLDIVNHVAEKTGVPKQKAEQVVDSLFNAMKNALAHGRRIELRGFGVFVVKPRKRGVGRNPRTGKEVPIPAGKTIRFKPGKDLTAQAVKN